MACSPAETENDAAAAAEAAVPVVWSRAANRSLAPALPDEPDWLGEFAFVQAADTQFGLISRYVDKQTPGDPAKEIHLARRLVREVNAMSPPPRFLIVCGDMLDAFPRREDPEQFARRRLQLAAFADCFRRLRPGVPLVCVCGNHDMGDQPSPDTVSIYRRTWGDDYFEFWIGGCQMLVLNSQYYVDSSLVPAERAEMHAWLLERLKFGSPIHRLVFMHVPPFVSDAADPDGYFTLPTAERLPLLDALVESGVSAVFCGHYHRNAGGLYLGRLPIVVTSAVGAQIGEDRHGYRLVTVAKAAVTHRYVEFDCPVNLPAGCGVCPGPDDEDCANAAA